MTKCTLRSPTDCGTSTGCSRCGAPVATPATIIQGGRGAGGCQTLIGCEGTGWAGAAGAPGEPAPGASGMAGGPAAVAPTTGICAVGIPDGGVTAWFGMVGVVWW